MDKAIVDKAIVDKATVDKTIVDKASSKKPLPMPKQISEKLEIYIYQYILFISQGNLYVFVEAS